MKRWWCRLVVGLCLLGCFSGIGARAEGDPQDSGDIFSLDLEQLAKLQVTGTAALTKTDSRRAPVNMTELDAQDVEQSGARDLDHLIEDYVPDAQVIAHQSMQNHIGFQGIISDREDQYLYQVNGRTMNQHLIQGADNERGIPLLGDIQSLGIVRGPASATHGAGAVAGVIGVQTYNGLTFQGTDFTFRQGVWDQYTGGEFRFGRKFSEHSGLFLYFGMADQPGADSPFYIGYPYPAKNGLPANVPGQPSSILFDRYGKEAFGQPRYKAHISYVHGGFEFWARLVQDGDEDRPRAMNIYTSNKPADLSVADWIQGRQMLNRQVTFTGTYKKALSRHWDLNLMQSGYVWAIRREQPGTQTTLNYGHAGEQDVFSRALAVWSPTENHSLAVGAEFSHDWFQDPEPTDALENAPIVTLRNWQTHVQSFLAEYQWKISSRWTMFLSARTDKHTFSAWLVSPRASLVYTPTDRDTFKLMAGKAVRHAGDEESWGQWERDHTMSSPETLDSYELAYEHKLTSHWTVGSNGFYHHYLPLAFSAPLNTSTSLGVYNMAGGELQANYTFGSNRITISEGVVRLLSASAPAVLGAGGEGISAMAYGYGDSLENWAPSITKVALENTLDKAKKWTASSSLVFYSGFPGAQDAALYNATLPSPSANLPTSEAGYTTPYGPNLYVNFGLEYRPAKSWSIRADGYNLAALASQTLSKRNYIYRMSEFSVEPASATLSLRYRL